MNNSRIERIMEECSKMSDVDLKNHLITLDFKGKEFKEQVLDELLRREFDRGVSYERHLNNIRHG